MDSDPPSPTQESEPKPEFRKLTNEAANRKYRRRSPGDGSPEEDGSPKRDNGSRRNSKVSDYERRNDDRVNDKSSSRSQHGRSSDSYRHSSRGYHNRHDEYSRHGKHADADDRSYAKSSSRSGRESRGGSNSDYRDREGDYNRSRDHQRDVDRYSRHGGRHDDRDRHARDRDDREEKRDGRSSRDHRGHRSDPSSKREMGDMKDLDGSKYSHEGKNNNDGLDTHEADGAGGVSEDKYAFVSEDFAAKKPKLFSLEESDARKDRSSSKQGEALVAKVTPEQAPANGSDSASNVDAAKVAAMKAAELVNKNLTSTGFMTADQKKKLLWGSKKNNNTEESSHRWDASLFSDRERQEKFQKLMSLRLRWYIWPLVGCEGGGESGHEIPEQPRRREAERTSAGFGEAIYCWPPTKRWPHCRVGSVVVYLPCSLSAADTLSRCLIWLPCKIITGIVVLSTYVQPVTGNCRILLAFCVLLYYCDAIRAVSSILGALF